MAATGGRETESGIEVKPVYTAADAAAASELPGEYPYTRGPYPDMYRGRPWTIRQYAGFASAEESNERYRYLLASGQTGLSIAFDLPTQLGYDSDDPLARGEVGRTGVSIDSIADMEILLAGIPLGEVSTSMTINAPAALLLLLYELVAEDQGVPSTALRGTVQNDILKEYIARGNYIFPPRPSMRLTTDLFAYCAERIPAWNTISISGYHIREAGSTAVQELAFTISNGIAYCTAAVEAGLSPDDFGTRLSFFFNAHNDFFQEVAKFRAARRLWARVMRERFGATNPKALALRFHAQTGGSTLTAQQPENNIVRVAIQALSAIAGGAQSLHTNSFDEALALPTEHAATIALRTQQILASEAGTTATADPFGGSFYIESLTDELEQRAWELIERVDELGGAVEAVEQGFIQGEIENSAFRWQQQVESGERVIVGVNEFVADSAQPIQLQSIDPDAERRQLARTAALRAGRNAAEADAALAAVRDVARGTANLLPTAAGRAARALHGGRDLRRAARGMGRARPRTRAAVGVSMRILLVSQMYPGPDDPDLGTFVAQGEQALRERGHEIELAVLDRRGGGKGRFLELRRRVRAASRPDVVWAHFLVPAGLFASHVDAPLVVTAHGRDVRNIGAIPGIARLTRRVVQRAATVVVVSEYLRRELEERLPDARGKTEVVDSGVDLDRFREVAARGGAGVTRVRARRLVDRAEERRSAGGRVRDAGARLADVRRRRAAARGALRQARRAGGRPGRARRRARVAQRSRRRLWAGARRAVRAVTARRHGVRAQRRRDARRRAAGVRAGRSRRARRSARRPGARTSPRDGRRAAVAQRSRPARRRRARRQAAGGTGGGDPPASRSRSASLTATSGSTPSSSPCSRATSSACS